MVIDTSAVIAILFDEPERPDFDRLIAAAPIRLISAVGRVETAIVVEARKGDAGRERLERFFSLAEIETVGVSPEQADLAIEAFRRYGKGRHPASLNLGDCFAYALAKTMTQPLLFKGRDFSLTDLASAVLSESEDN